jgi:hypothetical protein
VTRAGSPTSVGSHGPRRGTPSLYRLPELVFTERDWVFAPDAAAFDHGPSRSGEGWIDVLGSPLGFVYSYSPMLCNLPKASTSRRSVKTRSFR